MEQQESIVNRKSSHGRGCQELPISALLQLASFFYAAAERHCEGEANGAVDTARA